jgi:hypothetical protein
VWKWDALHFEAEPLLTYLGCECVDVLNYRGTPFFSMAEVMQPSCLRPLSLMLHESVSACTDRSLPALLAIGSR